MNVKHLRASTMGSYDDCEWKFYLQYICDIDCPAGKKANCGSLVHWVLEVLAKAKKTGHYKLNDKYIDPDYLLNICWKRYTEKTYAHLEWSKADYNFCKKMIDTVLNSKLHPFNHNILKTELQFELDILRPGFDPKDNIGTIKLRGTIDLVTQPDSQTIHVFDYKTGERKDWITGEPKEFDDFQKDLQLRVYDLALSIIYPHIPYRIFTLVYVRSGGPFTVTFGPEEREETIDIIRRYFNKMKSNEKPTRLRDDPTRRSQHWKCKYVCHLGKVVDPETGEILCDKYHKIFKTNTYQQATHQLIDISISAKGEKSRRNDYNNPKIHKGKIH